MKAKERCFGSNRWLDDVFASAPVRKVKGRTKWTHRHCTWVSFLNRLAYIESRNELVGLLALEYLQKQGRIKRFKEQPFTTPLDLWQKGLQAQAEMKASEYTPDFLAEDTIRTKYVIEVKSARFVSRSMEQTFEAWKSKFAEQGMKFLLWTDLDPLTVHLRRNLLQLRRTAVTHIEHDELDRLLHELRQNGPMPIWALYARNLDVDLISHAAWFGKVYFPLAEPLTERTLVGLEQTEDLAGLLLGAEPDMQSWWNSLEAA